MLSLQAASPIRVREPASLDSSGRYLGRPGESTASKYRANPVEAFNRAAGEMKFNNAFDPGESVAQSSRPSICLDTVNRILGRILEIRGGLAPLGPGWKWSRVAVRPSLNDFECHQLSRTEVLLIMGRPRPIWFLLETQFSVVSTR